MEAATQQPPTIESGVQLFSRISSTTSSLAGFNNKLFPEGGPFPNQAVEIVGHCTDQLLIDLMIRCIGPAHLNEEWKGLSAVFINTQRHINILMIIKALDGQLKALRLSSATRKKAVEEALGNLTIVDCFDEDQFDLALFGLEKSAVQAGKSLIALVVIDSLSGQYWIARSEKNFTALTIDYYVKSKLVACLSAIKNLNVVLAFGRDSNKSPAGVDYSLLCEEDGSLTVLNHEKETEVKLDLQLKPCVKFL